MSSDNKESLVTTQPGTSNSKAEGWDTVLTLPTMEGLSNGEKSPETPNDSEEVNGEGHVIKELGTTTISFCLCT